MDDQDPKLILLACRLCLAFAPNTERRKAIVRLRRLLPSADLPLRLDIEQCLAQHAGREESAEQSPRSTQTSFPMRAIIPQSAMCLARASSASPRLLADSSSSLSK